MTQPRRRPALVRTLAPAPRPTLWLPGIVAGALSMVLLAVLALL